MWYPAADFIAHSVRERLRKKQLFLFRCGPSCPRTRVAHGMSVASKQDFFATKIEIRAHFHHVIISISCALIHISIRVDCNVFEYQGADFAPCVLIWFGAKGFQSLNNQTLSFVWLRSKSWMSFSNQHLKSKAKIICIITQLALLSAIIIK